MVSMRSYPGNGGVKARVQPVALPPRLKTSGSHDITFNGDRSMHKLAVALGHAQTVRSLADEVGNYCFQAFRSPAGMIFLERDNDLELVSQWPYKEIPKDTFAEQMIRKGPVARAFRSGQPVFCRQERMPNSKVSRFLCRALGRFHWQTVSFVPMR